MLYIWLVHKSDTKLYNICLAVVGFFICFVFHFIFYFVLFMCMLKVLVFSKVNMTLTCKRRYTNGKSRCSLEEQILYSFVSAVLCNLFTSCGMLLTVCVFSMQLPILCLLLYVCSLPFYIW